MTRRRYVATAPFEAARRLPAAVGAAGGLHGHGFQARLEAELPAAWGGFAGAETDQLRAALAACVEPLDYGLLNDQVALPTDANLARWVRTQLAVPGVQRVGVQSTRDRGAELDGDGHVRLWRRFRFEAAHRLPNVPPGHQCGRMHGHGFEVILHAVPSAPEVVDYDLLEAFWAPLGNQLDQACLNDLPGLENPTSEHLAVWVWGRLCGDLPALSWVTVYETSSAGCHYDGRRYRIWKDQRFEGALQLAQAPAGDRRRGLHGHSYLCRLHLAAPLNQVLGWTVDYGDVKALFAPLRCRLDHHRLDEVDGLGAADPASIAAWIRAQLQPQLPALDRIDLYPRPGCGLILSWGGSGPALPA